MYILTQVGNISSLTREGFGTNNYINYSGSKLTQISGFINSGYGYDENGNLNSDSGKGLGLSYNQFNLPAVVTQGGNTLTYTYDASGAKLRKVNGLIGASVATDYIEGIQYTGGVIDFIQTEEGLARNNQSGGYSYEYNLIDHLGNVRYSFNINPSTNALTRIQADDYYAFGLQKPVNGGTNKYLYNGKELQDGLGQYDYGARFYDPVIGRWISVDPSSEDADQESWTPFGYGFNDPIKNVDPDGRVGVAGALVGAAIGGAVGAIWEAGTQIYNSGKVTNWGAVGGSAAQGAITGAVAGATGGASLIVNVGANAGANILGGAVNRAIQGQGTTLKDVAVDGAIGGGFAAAGKAAGAIVENGLNKLSNQAKGALGEAVTKAKYGASGYVSNGEAVVATGRKTATGLEQVAKYDHNMKNVFTGKQLTVESKFNTSGLTSNQRAALKNVTTPGGVIVNRTTSQQLGNAAQSVVTGTGGQIKRN